MIVTKDRREIELMAEAGRIVALVHEKLKEVIVPGITTKQIDEICEKVIRDNNATPSFLHLYGFPNSVCTSINEVVVHGIPSNQVLKEGDIFALCLSEEGYFFGRILKVSTQEQNIAKCDTTFAELGESSGIKHLDNVSLAKKPNGVKLKFDKIV